MKPYKTVKKSMQPGAGRFLRTCLLKGALRYHRGRNINAPTNSQVISVYSLVCWQYYIPPKPQSPVQVMKALYVRGIVDNPNS